MPAIAAIRIDASNPIGAIIIAILIVAAATGLVYGALSTVVEKVVLPIMKVPEAKRDGHIISKIVMYIALLVALFGLVSIILPTFGVDTGPLNLLNLVDL